VAKCLNINSRSSLADLWPRAVSYISFVLKLLRVVTRRFHTLSRRRGLACLFVAVLCPAVRLAVLPILPRPVPSIQDEFSYLLASDTFSHGRLASPPHPFWEHFETFHVLQQPTYASKYPPLQGMVLAIGQRARDPWLGVCLSMGLMCGAICWMLQGWLPPAAALLGALLAVIQIGVTSYWMNSYWGGAVAALGGALVIGALGRLRRKIEIRTSALFFVGVAVLINSRPFEGTVLVAIAGAALLLVIYPKRDMRRFLGRRFIPVGTAVLALAGAAMCWYNYRVTGSPLRLPYLEYERQYAISPALLWGGIRPAPPYHHVVMRRFTTEYEAKVYETTRSNPGIAMVIKMWILDQFFVGHWMLLVPLLIPGIWTSPKISMCALMLGAFLLVMGVERFVLPHYAAPIAGLFFLVYAAGWRRLRHWKVRGRPYGCMIAYALVVLMVIHAARPASVYASQSEFGMKRASIVERLNREPGKHLVFVRYASDHNVHNEWVFNAADIDSSRIVWAREMGADLDRPLVQYFADRRVWLLQPDDRPSPDLRRYQEGE
jgi:hypothetical protein